MGNRRRCILHMGTMKTGTTSIQAWLKHHQGWLSENGWVYPGWPMRDAASIRDRLQSLPEDRNVVISDEGLWQFGGLVTCDMFGIRRFFNDFDIQVLVYFRRPDLFLESRFKQWLKAGGRNEHDIHSYLNLSTVRVETFTQMLDFLCVVFGQENVTVAPFERSQMKNGNVVDDFLARTGLPVPAKGKLPPPPAGESNVSPGADAMLMAGLLRKVFNVRQAQIAEILKQPASDYLKNIRTSVFTAEEAAAIRAEYRPAFQRIQALFRTGAEPDFFSDWGEDTPHPEVSILRKSYDLYMADLDRPRTPADK